MYNDELIEERFDRIENLLLLQKPKLTLKEAALYTGYKESYVYKLTASQKIPHAKPMGGAIIFDRKELDDFLSQNRIKTIREIEMEANQLKLK